MKSCMRLACILATWMCHSATGSGPRPIVKIHNYGNSSTCEPNHVRTHTIPATDHYCHNSVRYLCDTEANKIVVRAYTQSITKDYFGADGCSGNKVDATLVLKDGTSKCTKMGINYQRYHCSTSDSPVVMYDTDSTSKYLVSGTCDASSFLAAYTETSKKYTCCGDGQVSVETFKKSHTCTGERSIITRDNGVEHLGQTLTCINFSGNQEGQKACPLKGDRAITGPSKDNAKEAAKDAAKDQESGLERDLDGILNGKDEKDEKAIAVAIAICVFVCCVMILVLCGWMWHRRRAGKVYDDYAAVKTDDDYTVRGTNPW